MVSFLPTLTTPEIIFKIILQAVFIVIIILVLKGVIKPKWFLVGAIVWLGALIIKNVYLLLR